MTDTKRPFSNPLALALLVLLYERPMHPYEMAATLRERRKESSIKLNYGSLYTVVDNLANGPTWIVGENMRAAYQMIGSASRNEAVQFMAQASAAVMGGDQ